MPDQAGFLGEPENPVVVRSRGPDVRIQQGPVKGGEAVDIVAASQGVRGEVRLEQGVKGVPDRRAEGGLVGIDEVRPGAADLRHCLIQGGWVQKIPLAQQPKVCAGGHVQTGVDPPDSVRGGVQGQESDPAVLGGEPLADPGNVLPGGVAAVGQEQLPIAVGLVQDGLDRIAQIFRRRVVQGQQNAEPDSLGKSVAALPPPFPRGNRGPVSRGSPLQSQGGSDLFPGEGKAVHPEAA